MPNKKKKGGNKGGQGQQSDAASNQQQGGGQRQAAAPPPQQGSADDFPALGGPQQGGRGQQGGQAQQQGQMQGGGPQSQQQGGRGRGQQGGQRPGGGPQPQQQGGRGRGQQGGPQQQRQGSVPQQQQQGSPQPTPAPMTTPTSAQAGASKSAGSDNTNPQQNLVKRMETLKIKKEIIEGDGLPPEKRADGSFPGKKGKPCQLEVNHFKLNPLKIKKLYMYNIQIVAPWKRPYSKKDNELYREVFIKWLKICPELKHLRQEQFAFNGNNVFYSTQSIPGKIKDIQDITAKGDMKELKFHVTEVFQTGVIRVTEDLQTFMDQGRKAFPNQVGTPQDVLTALDIILQQSVRLDKMYRTIGRSFFREDGRVLDVGFGKEVWIGTFTNSRPYGWKDAGYLMTLNVDVSNKPATINCHMTRESGAGRKDSYIQRVLCKSRQVDFNRGLGPRDLDTLAYDLKGMKIKYELPNGNKRVYKFNKLVECARKQIIPDLKKTVEQYFKDEHNARLKYPLLPCLHLGSLQKTIYIPAEFCYMEKQALPRGKKLPDDAVATMIRSTATRPEERKQKILDSLQKTNKFYANDPYAKEFGISFEQAMLKVSGRVLDPPSLEYKDKLEQRINFPGSWRPSPRHKYVDGANLDHWAVLDLCHLSDSEYAQILNGFQSVGKEVGINISTAPENLWHQRTDERRLANDFEAVVEEYRKANLTLQLIMVIFPFKGGNLYDTVKRLGDIQYHIPTQCVVKKTLFKMGQLNRQSVGNICLKINSKLGGINHVLHARSRPPVLDKPIMIMGADVSHAPPESKGEKPSIVAVVGSMDPKASKYETEIRIQNSEQNEEIIQDMKEITRKLLFKFYSNTNRKPDKIIMFRDGVSEGQFLKVLAHELMAMREACNALEQGYQPQITFIVVQKRHHTRFFPADGNRYKNGNVMAGTVVDKGINHPKEGDFYLVSHEGIQGTSRPTHYQVLWDDNNMSADDIEELTYFLCHLYSRCTRSVSYPAPTYYSHLAADRARKHHNSLSEKRDPKIKEKLEKGDVKIMYFV